MSESMSEANKERKDGSDSRDYLQEIAKAVGEKLLGDAKAEIQTHTGAILYHLLELHRNAPHYQHEPLGNWRKHQPLPSGNIACKDLTVYDLMQNLERQLVNLYIKPVLDRHVKALYEKKVGTLTPEVCEAPEVYQGD